jgi:hypothetical protein
MESPWSIDRVEWFEPILFRLLTQQEFLNFSG